MPDITLIIPFLNEQENAAYLVGQLTDFYAQNKSLQFETILVDDGSTDDSVSTFKNLFQEKILAAKIITLSKNYGAHAAVRAGLQQCTGKYALFVAADLQDPLALIIDLHNRAEQGFDVVFGIRNGLPTSIFEKLFSKFFATMMRKFAFKNYPENGFDVVFFNQKVQREVNRNIEANSSIHLQILSLGYKQSFINYDKASRKSGKSKWTLQKKIKLFIDSFVAFSFAPIRFVSIVGVIFFMLGIAWSIYISSRKILYNDLASGWPALTSILLLGFGITNIGLGIIAEYLWRTLDASRNRPVFVIDEIIETKTIA